MKKTLKKLMIKYSKMLGSGVYEDLDSIMGIAGSSIYMFETIAIYEKKKNRSLDEVRELSRIANKLNKTTREKYRHEYHVRGYDEKWEGDNKKC